MNPIPSLAALLLFPAAVAAQSVPVPLGKPMRLQEPAHALAVTANGKLVATSAGVQREPGSVLLEPKSLSNPESGTFTFELGTLYVPEKRAEPKSRTIGIGFARFSALKPTGAPPLFLLPGGPGDSFLANLAAMMSGVERYRHVSDVVLVDQRGASRRGDVLAFPTRRPVEPLDQPGSVARSTAAAVKRAREAVAALASTGIDLRGYTVKECADDVNDLRQALGYDQITLVGTSFGSQWSFAIMRRHPDIVARALLSGVEPLDYGYDMPSHIVAALQRMWWEAEKDPRFGPYLPPGGMMAAAREVLRRLDRSPMLVSVKDNKTTGTVTVCLGREDFQRDLLRGGPALVLSAYYGHYDRWAQTVLARRRGEDRDIPPITWLIDTSLNVTPKRGYLLRTDPGTELLGHWNFDADMATAATWPTPDVGDEFRTEVVSRIPVVFAQGDWDTQTPVENALNIAPYFPHGRVLIAVHGRHGVLGPIAGHHPAVMAALLDFLRTGTTVNLPARVTLPVPKFEMPDFPPPAATGHRQLK